MVDKLYPAVVYETILYLYKIIVNDSMLILSL